MFEVVEGEPMSIAQFRSGLRYEIKKQMSHVYFFFFFEKLSHVYLKDLEDALQKLPFCNFVLQCLGAWNMLKIQFG